MYKDNRSMLMGLDDMVAVLKTLEININLSTSIICKNGPNVKINTRFNYNLFLYFFKTIFKVYKLTIIHRRNILINEKLLV